MDMNFRTIKQIKDAIDTCRKNNPKMAHFPISMKVGIVKYRKANWAGSDCGFSKEVGLTGVNFIKWRKQHDEGLLVEGASYSVSKVALASTSQIIRDLKDKIRVTQKQLALVVECEKNGLIVALAA